MQRSSLVQRAFVLRPEGMGRRVATGAGFQFLGLALRTILTIGSTAILARLLLPADFGYIAMATVVTEFAALFGAFGFTNVLIQRRVINRVQLDTVFWATLAVGSALSLAVFLLSFAAGWLFADPAVGPILRFLCLNFVLGSLTAVPWVVMARLMRFRTEFWINIGTVIARISAAVGCALAGFGLWSLVVGALVGALTNAVLGFVNVPYRPRWRFQWTLISSTWRTSGSYFGGSVMYYLNTSVDLLLIGRQLGPTPLGYYQNARSLTDEIRARIATPIQHVLFPAFSALQSERERFQQLVIRASRLLAAVVIPVGVGVSANATNLVLVLYGEPWRPMIPVMAMFGISAAVRASTAIATPLFNAHDRVSLALRYNVLGTLLLIVGVYFALPWGIDGVAVAMAGASFYALVPLRRAFALIDLNARDITSVLGPPTLASAVMWLAIESLARWGGPSSPALGLFAHVVAGALTYLLVLHLISRRYLQDLLQVRALFKRPS